MSLHARIAEALGWTEQQAQSVPLQGLRELVRPVSPKLAAEITNEIQSGRYIVGEPLRPKRRRR